MKRRESRKRSALLNLSILLLGVVVLAFVASGLNKGCSTPVDPRRASDSGELIGDYIQVEVLNGCGKAGLAGTMTDYLRERGFDVVKNGNYSSFDVAHTQVLNRVDDPHAAEQVARALGLETSSIVARPDPSLFVEASVLIGCDFQSVAPFSLKSH
jgi:LytR cell envelope-related transcriptional attenuator